LRVQQHTKKPEHTLALEFRSQKLFNNLVGAKLSDQRIAHLQWKDGNNLEKVPNLFGTCPNVQGEAPA
jgi:hypothetical protein